jgi:lysozyme
MNISSVGLNLIKSFEGCVLHTYKDVVGVRTIGYGHTGADVHDGQTITQAQADALLLADCKRFVDGVNSVVKVPLNQNQFDALVSFCFNLGVGSLKTSTLLEKLNRKDYLGASNEFLRWNKAGGQVLAGLTRRRQAEKELFNKAVPVPPKPVPQPVYCTVVKGDVVGKIASKFGVSIAQIKSLNNLDANYTIRVGQKLRVK